ncbi:DUF3795 domain-containing protein [Desulforhabdus sp. TSK]|uniref:DUF3795 domain-containing protein n=1 Tax=Desulforhabdus sp. TSK TaxID=2925014 RepID=UPI0034D4CBDA
MAINPNLISPCGLYCGVCAIYIAARDNNIKLKERLVNLYKGGAPDKGTLPNSDKLSIEDIHCGGCLSDDLFMHCQQCEIRSCTRASKKDRNRPDSLPGFWSVGISGKIAATS